ncbi:MAG: hypothetical protein MI740_10375 [Halanaerobiales bacterium]|nr:hypothetical protein [Halanaerobiales bacterium]
MKKYDFYFSAHKENKTKKDKTYKQDLDDYLQKEREKNKHDPRPDIEPDHYIWLFLLRTAEKVDRMTYGLLHGLRCAGCRIQINRNKNTIKLDLDNSPELLKMYLPGEKQKHEQMKIFQGDFERQKNIAEAKREQELLDSAKDKILNEVLLPMKAELGLVFKKIAPLIKVAENEIGIHFFNLNQLNNYLKRMEELKKDG